MILDSKKLEKLELQMKPLLRLPFSFNLLIALHAEAYETDNFCSTNANRCMEHVCEEAIHQ